MMVTWLFLIAAAAAAAAGTAGASHSSAHLGPHGVQQVQPHATAHQLWAAHLQHPLQAKDVGGSQHRCARICMRVCAFVHVCAHVHESAHCWAHVMYSLVWLLPCVYLLIDSCAAVR